MQHISISVVPVQREPIMKTLTVSTVPPVQEIKQLVMIRLYIDTGVGMVSLDYQDSNIILQIRCAYIV